MTIAMVILWNAILYYDILYYAILYYVRCAMLELVIDLGLIDLLATAVLFNDERMKIMIRLKVCCSVCT